MVTFNKKYKNTDSSPNVETLLESTEALKYAEDFFS